MVEEDSQLTCNLNITEIEVTYTSSTDLREAEADENNEIYEKISQSKKLQKLMNSIEREKKLRLKNDRKESLNLILSEAFATKVK